MLIRRINQGGSIASYIVIAVILITGMIGTVYFVNKRGDQARKEQTIAANEKEKTDKETKKTNEPVKTDTSKDSTEVNSVVESADSSDSQDLPATGLELSVVQLIGIYSLTATMTAYVISRRKLTRSL